MEGNVSKRLWLLLHFRCPNVQKWEARNKNAVFPAFQCNRFLLLLLPSLMRSKTIKYNQKKYSMRAAH